MSEPFTIIVADWQQDQPALQEIRKQVFIQEQSVPVELEWDGLDEAALHLLAISENNEPIATARLLTDGHIGRVAVLSNWRKQGIGTAMMQAIIKQAEQLEYKQLKLAAQIQALPFYVRLGFEAYGDEFMDAGILHKNMRKVL